MKSTHGIWKTAVKVKLLALFLASSFVLAACGDRYRYPCQDPANATTAECQCDNPNAPRTKNKALNAIEPVTTTTIKQLVGFDC